MTQPQPVKFRFPDYSFPAAVLGGLVTAVGLAVAIGWHARQNAIIQILPISPPMQYNTALCFIFSGMGIIALMLRRRLLVLFAAVFISAVGLAVLVEYIGRVDLGIDQLMMKAYLVTKITHPGRLAPNTAVCFAVTGIILGIAGLLNRPWKFAAMHYLALLLVANAGSVLLGYMNGMEAGYGWGSLTRMAIHTALSFLFLGIAFMCLAWKKHKTHWLGALVFILGILLSLQVLQVLNETEDKKFRKDFKFNALNRFEALRREFEFSEQILKAFIAFYEGSQTVEQKEFGAFALRVLSGKQPIQAVEWLPRVLKNERSAFEKQYNLSVKKSVSHHEFKPDDEREVYYPVTFVEPFASNGVEIGFNHASDSLREQAIQFASREHRFMATPPLRLFREFEEGQKGLIVFYPVYHSSVSSQEVKGFIAGVFRMRPFVQTAFSYLAPAKVEVSIWDVTAERLFLYGSPDMPNEKHLEALTGMDYVYRNAFDFAGRKYELLFAPSPDAPLGGLNWLVWAGFFSVLVISLTIAIFLNQALHQKDMIGVANKKLDHANEMLEKLSVTDPLTGLLNRRGLEKELTREKNLILRHDVQTYAMLIDLDDFKPINTVHGHAAGDLVLQQIAAQIKSSIRVSDHAARIGGDEFLVLLTHLNKDTVAESAERVRASVGKVAVLAPDGKKVRAQCSAGLMRVNSEATLDGIILTAGKALQESKSAGKNRLILVK